MSGSGYLISDEAEDDDIDDGNSLVRRVSKPLMIGSKRWLF